MRKRGGQGTPHHVDLCSPVRAYMSLAASKRAPSRLSCCWQVHGLILSVVRDVASSTCSRPAPQSRAPLASASEALAQAARNDGQAANSAQVRGCAQLKLENLRVLGDAKALQRTLADTEPCRLR